MRTWLAFGAVAFAFLLAPMAMSQVALGNLFVINKVTPPTCAAGFEGVVTRQKGGAGEGYTKECYCVSDGAATPVFSWCSKQWSATTATYTCAGGSASTCP